MQRLGMTWRVDPAHWEEYKAVHLQPWPDLVAALQGAGIHNYSIFAFGTRVFAYLEIEGDDAGAALAAVERTDIKKKWNDAVTVWVLPEAADGAGVQFMSLDPIFYCP